MFSFENKNRVGSRQTLIHQLLSLGLWESENGSIFVKNGVPQNRTFDFQKIMGSWFEASEHHMFAFCQL